MNSLLQKLGISLFGVMFATHSVLAEPDLADIGTAAQSLKTGNDGQRAT